MSSRNPVIRTTNSLSLAAWFGGSLMGLVALPRAGADGDGHATHVEGAGWSAWQPIQAGAIASQLASSAALTLTNAHRVAGQRGVARASVVRTALFGAAIGATALAARSGRRLEHALDGGAAARSGDGDPDGAPAEDVDGLERRTRILQATVPVLTGALIAMDSLMGEQQRPMQVLKGTAQRILPDAVADRIAA
jgi:hypothetical protein